MGPVIKAVREGSSARERTRDSVRERWDDVVYRDLDRRVLSRLAAEAQLALAALARAENELSRALQLLED